jgi:DNA-binding transcriptional MerR regulator
VSAAKGRRAPEAGVGALEKAPDAFRTISEVAEEIDVPQHVLRFWESRFTQIRPLKRGGGRRYYRPDDIDLLRGVRHLLYGEGYTIRGVQRILREEGLSFVQNVWRAGAAQPADEPEEEDAAERADTLEAEDEDEVEADGDDEAEGDDDEDADEDTDDEAEEEPEKAPVRARVPSLVPGPAPAAARSAERREPTLMPPTAAAPVRPVAPAQSRPAAVDSQNRQKLLAALDDLIACRNLIQAALTKDPVSDERLDEAG